MWRLLIPRFKYTITSETTQHLIIIFFLFFFKGRRNVQNYIIITITVSSLAPRIHFRYFECRTCKALGKSIIKIKGQKNKQPTHQPISLDRKGFFCSSQMNPWAFKFKTTFTSFYQFRKSQSKNKKTILNLESEKRDKWTSKSFNSIKQILEWQ